MAVTHFWNFGIVGHFQDRDVAKFFKCDFMLLFSNLAEKRDFEKKHNNKNELLLKRNMLNV